MPNLDVVQEPHFFSIEDWEAQLKPILKEYYLNESGRLAVFKQVVEMLRSQILLFSQKHVFNAFEVALQNLGSSKAKITFPFDGAIGDAIRSTKERSSKILDDGLLPSITKRYAYRVFALEPYERRCGNQSYGM